MISSIAKVELMHLNGDLLNGFKGFTAASITGRSEMNKSIFQKTKQRGISLPV